MSSYRRYLLLLACATACLSCGLFAGQATAAAPPCADLYVENVVVSPTNPVQGMPATISITVHNGGTCTAGGFVTQFRTSLGSQTGPSESISSLAAGESKTLNLPFVFTKSGNYEAVVEVDTGHSVPETNTENNLEILPITVLPPGINLVLDRFSVAPVAPDPTNSVVEGRVARATIEVTNTGNVPAGPFVVQWTPYAFAKPLTQTVSGLGPGATTTVTMEYTFPFAGKVHGTALVNSTNSVVETDKLDNSATLETEVQPQLPNLRVAPEGIRVNPAPAGSTSTIEIEVENDGNNPAGDFVVTWKPGPLIPAQSQQVNGLEVGARKTITFSNVYKVAGKFEGKVTLDSTEVIPQVNESDTTTPTVENVPAATVDLTITEMSMTPTDEFLPGGPNGDFAAATVTQGVPQTLSLTVKNLGNSPSPSFVTSWNPSAFSIIVPGNQTLTQESGPLGPGESRQLTFSFTYPQPGNFRSVAEVNAFHTVKETNESNNQRILNVTVVPAKIALVFTKPIAFSPAQPVVGEKAAATVSIRNNGPLATGSFAVQLTPQEEGFPQTQFVNGLNVGEERTLTFPVTYSKKGTYTATAVIDPFNQVVKTVTPDQEQRSVTVVPKSATVNVTLDHFNVIALPSGYEEWKMIELLFDPGASCTFKLEIEILGISKTFEATLKDVACAETGERYEENFVHPGEELAAGLTLKVHLEENTPLVAAAVGLSLNKFLGVLTNIGLPGIAPLIRTRPEYLHPPSGLQKVEGMGCAQENKTVVNGGHCFDAFFGVSLLNHVGMNATPASAKAASETVEQGLAKLGELGHTAVNASQEAKGHATMRLTTKSSVAP